MNRENQIVQTSIAGLITNLVLAGIKVVTGMLSNSITFILDGVNSLTDALSSLLTMLGARFSQRLPDKQHPMGYGRIEYITSFIIAAIILYTGISSLWESIQKIIEPGVPDYSMIGLILIAITMVAKFFLGVWTQRRGEALNSTSLIAAGKDGRNDALVTAATLIGAALYLIFHINISGWLGAVISIVIIRTGIEILRDSISELLGQRISPELALDIKKEIKSIPGVEGVFDLLLTSYGPNNMIGSCHIEVLNSMTMNELDALERKISETVFQKFHIVISGISIYTKSPEGSESEKIESRVRKMVLQDDNVLSMHGFYADPENKTMTFDTVLSFDVPDFRAKKEEIINEVLQIYPEYDVKITIDRDLSE